MRYWSAAKDCFEEGPNGAGMAVRLDEVGRTAHEWAHLTRQSLEQRTGRGKRERKVTSGTSCVVAMVDAKCK